MSGFFQTVSRIVNKLFFHPSLTYNYEVNIRCTALWKKKNDNICIEISLGWISRVLFMQPHGVNFSLKLKVHFTDVCQLLRNQNKEQKKSLRLFYPSKGLENRNNSWKKMLLSEGIFSMKWLVSMEKLSWWLCPLVDCRFRRHAHLAEWFYISWMAIRGLCMLSNASSMIDATDVMNQAK